MTTTNEPRFTGSHRPTRDTDCIRFSDGTTINIRDRWSPEDARDGLINEWLTPAVEYDGEPIEPQPHHHRYIERARRIVDAAGNVLGVLIGEEEWAEGREAIHTLNADMYGHKGEQYKPYIHAPNANPDRLIDTTQLERLMVNLVHGDAEPTKEERDKIHMWAIVASVQIALLPDSRGIVPVMTLGRVADKGTNEYLWSALSVTPVAGLYVRTEHAIWGEDYALTTGSGYTVIGGINDLAHAEALAVKLATALPGCDWFTATEDTFTAATRETAIAVIKAHGRWPREDTDTTPKDAA